MGGGAGLEMLDADGEVRGAEWTWRTAAVAGLEFCCLFASHAALTASVRPGLAALNSFAALSPSICAGLGPLLSPPLPLPLALLA